MAPKSAWQEVAETENFGHIDPQAYLYSAASVPTIVAIASLQSSTFEIYRGCLIREGTSHENVDLWLEELDSTQAAERMVNHLHIWDVADFGPRSSEFIAAWIASGWSTSARSQFPELQVRTSHSEGGYGYEVNIWTEPDAKPNQQA